MCASLGACCQRRGFVVGTEMLAALRTQAWPILTASAVCMEEPTGQRTDAFMLVHVHGKREECLYLALEPTRETSQEHLDEMRSLPWHLKFSSRAKLNREHLVFTQDLELMVKLAETCDEVYVFRLKYEAVSVERLSVAAFGQRV